MMKPTHPIWQTVHAVAIITACAGAMWLNATNFDATEIKALLQIGLAVGGLNVASGWMARRGERMERMEP